MGANLATNQSTSPQFKYIVQNLHNRRSKWKKLCSSLAGRVMLSKSIISSISYYHMQCEDPQNYL